MPCAECGRTDYHHAECNRPTFPWAMGDPRWAIDRQRAYVDAIDGTSWHDRARAGKLPVKDYTSR